MRKDAFGLPLGEFLMWAVVAGIALGVLGRSIQTVLELTEKTAVEAALMNMRSGLRLEKARLLASGHDLRGLAGLNPLVFLEKSGQGGLSELAAQIRPLDFHFDAQHGCLTYQPVRQRFLKLQAAGADKLLKWQTLAHKPDGSDVEIVALTPYEWF